MSVQSLSTRSVTEQQAAGAVAVIGGTVIDGSGRKPIRDAVILIDGQRIKVVGDRATPIPPQVKQITASGKFVIPGLMVPFQFLVNGLFPTIPRLFEERYDEVAIEAAQLALRGGVTTVFDSWGPRDGLTKARNAINQG